MLEVGEKDTLLYHFGQDGGEIGGGVWFNANAVWQIISGEAEPYALLPFQMPASMDAVDAQAEDTIRDVECDVAAASIQKRAANIGQNVPCARRFQLYFYLTSRSMYPYFFSNKLVSGGIGTDF